MIAFKGCYGLDAVCPWGSGVRGLRWYGTCEEQSLMEG